MSTDDILKELAKLESLGASGSSSSSSKKKSSKSTSSSTTTSSIPEALSQLEATFALAQSRIEQDPSANVDIIARELLSEVERARAGVDRGLKEWYSGLSKVGKAIEKRFPQSLTTISSAYDTPPPATPQNPNPSSQLFSSPAASKALDLAILESMARRGAWDSVTVMENAIGVKIEPEKRRQLMEMQSILSELESGNVESALRWTSKHHAYLSSPPHPSSLPFYLHRSRYISILLQQSSGSDASNPAKDRALQYARDHLFPYLHSHSQALLSLLGALALTPDATSTLYADLLSPDLHAPLLVPLFEAEYCRLHGWPKEDPLSVVVEVGANGALGRIEKGRKVVESRLGPVRAWEELPMEIPIPSTRRYHSVFACPVSKEQATDANPPKMLSCGHVIANDSLQKLSKHGRAVKCPYCPAETAVASAKRLYF